MFWGLFNGIWLYSGRGLFLQLHNFKIKLIFLRNLFYFVFIFQFMILRLIFKTSLVLFLFRVSVKPLKYSQWKLVIKYNTFPWGPQRSRNLQIVIAIMSFWWLRSGCHWTFVNLEYTWTCSMSYSLWLWSAFATT